MMRIVLNCHPQCIRHSGVPLFRETEEKKRDMKSRPIGRVLSYNADMLTVKRVEGVPGVCNDRTDDSA